MWLLLVYIVPVWKFKKTRIYYDSYILLDILLWSNDQKKIILYFKMKK